MNEAERSTDANRPGECPPEVSSAREAEIVTAALADASAAGAPLAAGLRAVADERPGGRVARVLRWMASELECGRSLEEVVASCSSRWVRFPAGLVRAAARTGRLSQALVELMDHERRMRELTRSVAASLAYPALLAVMAWAVVLGVDALVIGPFSQMFEDFELELPYMTRTLAEMHRTGIWWLVGGMVPAAIAAALAFRAVAGPARWRRALATVPLVGALAHWAGVAELARLFAVLIEHGVGVPEALRLAGAGVRDANVGQVAGQLADGVERGQRLETLLQSTYRLPATLVPVVGWGERTGRLGEAFRLAGEMYEQRVQLRAELLRTLLPPLILLFVATMVVASVFAMILPLVSMIQGLS